MTTPFSDTCDIDFVDKEKVKRVAGIFADNNDLIELSEIFKLLGDPTRLKIILALKEAELCVCDLASLLGITSSAVSHQLRLLRNLHLVKFRRAGKIAYYSLDDLHVAEIIQVTQTHIKE